VVQATAAEGIEVPVELGADPADFAAGDARPDTEGFDQIVDLAGRHAVHVGLHHHCEQGTVDTAASLEQRREERALPQLGDREFHVARRGGDQLGTVPIALGHPSLGALMRAGTDHGDGLGLDQLLQNPLQARPDGVGHLAGLERGEQFGQVRIVEGHRRGGLLRGPGKEHVRASRR